MQLKHFFIDTPLSAGAHIATPEGLQTRLHRVLRLGEGAEIALFNGVNGLWAARVADAKARQLHLTHQLQPQPETHGLTLVLGLPKREAWESALRQATELGASAIQPLVTQYSQRDKINPARAHTLLVEAAEQCERLTLPTLHPVQPFDAWLKGLQTTCVWAYERGHGNTPQTHAQAVLVGPEGGFSPGEVAALRAHPQIQEFSLGPTILRTDTAVVAAIAVQPFCK